MYNSFASSCLINKKMCSCLCSCQNIIKQLNQTNIVIQDLNVKCKTIE